MENFKPEEILAGSIDTDIAPLLKSMSVDQLEQLHDMEEDGKNRTTLIDAIHRELSDRDADKVPAGEGETPDAGDDGQDGGGDADKDPAGDDGNEVDPNIVNDANENAADAENGAAGDNGPIASGDVGKEPPGDDNKPVAAVEPPALKIKKPKAGAKIKFKKQSGDFDPAALPDVLQIVLTNETDEVQAVPIPASSRLDFDYLGRRNALIYKRDIRIDRELERAVIKSAWLLDMNGIAVACCAIQPVINGGGGRSAEIPANNLIFHFSKSE